MSIFIWIPIWIVVGWLVFSMRFIRRDEIAAVYWLEKEWYPAGPGGLIFVPLGIATADIYPSTVIEMEIPGEPEDVQKTDQENIQPGKVGPIRIPQPSAELAEWYLPMEDNASPQELADAEMVSWEEYKNHLTTKTSAKPDSDEFKALVSKITNDPLNNRLTGEPDGVIRFQLVKEHLFQFKRTIGSIRKAKKQLNDTFAQTLLLNLSRITVDHASKNTRIIDAKLLKRLRELVKDTGDKFGVDAWGIHIVQASLKSIDPGKEVNMAMARSAASYSERQATIEKAQGAAETKRANADAEEYEQERIGNGQAKRIAAVAAAMNTPEARFTAVLESVERQTEKANVIIAGRGGLAAEVATIFRATNKSLDEISKVKVEK